MSGVLPGRLDPETVTRARISLQKSRMVIREVLDNGLRLITETMPHVRSVSDRRLADARLAPRERRARAASRTSSSTCSSRARPRARAEDIAQAIDSIGGQLDAFTAKEYASYYIKVLDEHLPLAVDLLSDIVHAIRRSRAEEIEREKKVILEEIKMVEDTPDDLVHELFTQHFWEGHPLGRPILGSKETVESFTREIAARLLPRRLRRAEPDHLGGRQSRARAGARAGRARVRRRCRRTARRSATAAARRAAGDHRGRRSSNRATSVSAPTAIRRIMMIATSATS